jgi:hypothetical protein
MRELGVSGAVVRAFGASAGIGETSSKQVDEMAGKSA